MGGNNYAVYTWCTCVIGPIGCDRMLSVGPSPTDITWTPLPCSIHTFASWLSLLPTKLWFDHFWAHTAIVIFVILVATWNGASYYFRVRTKHGKQLGGGAGGAAYAGAPKTAPIDSVEWPAKGTCDASSDEACSPWLQVFAKQLMKEQAERQAATSAGAERKAA